LSVPLEIQLCNTVSHIFRSVIIIIIIINKVLIKVTLNKVTAGALYIVRSSLVHSHRRRPAPGVCWKSNFQVRRRQISGRAGKQRAHLPRRDRAPADVGDGE